MFEWTPGTTIMEYMTGSKDNDLNEENSEVQVIEDIAKEVIEE